MTNHSGGWYHESRRHSLASRGISTNNNIKTPIPKTNIEETPIEPKFIEYIPVFTALLDETKKTGNEWAVNIWLTDDGEYVLSPIKEGHNYSVVSVPSPKEINIAQSRLFIEFHTHPGFFTNPSTTDIKQSIDSGTEYMAIGSIPESEFNKTNHELKIWKINRDHDIQHKYYISSKEEQREMIDNGEIIDLVYKKDIEPNSGKTLDQIMFPWVYED